MGAAFCCADEMGAQHCSPSPCAPKEALEGQPSPNLMGASPFACYQRAHELCSCHGKAAEISCNMHELKCVFISVSH